MEKNTALLSLKGIHTSYGIIEILKGISLEIREGEIACLLGANGAGKSTTLLTICGVNRPTEGSIKLSGKMTNGLPPHEIVKRAYPSSMREGGYSQGSVFMKISSWAPLREMIRKGLGRIWKMSMGFSQY